MKLINLQALKINATFILVSLTGIFSLTSCVKSDDSKTNIAALTLIHASPGLSPIDFYINGVRVNGDSIISYTDTIPYKLFSSGSLPVVVKKNISSIIYISQTIDLQPEKYYSFFVTGKPDAVTYLFTQDNIIPPASGKAKLRFLNLSPDSSPLDLKLSSSNTLFTGQAFKSYTDFASIDPGTYTVGIYEQGNNTALAQQTIEVEAGLSYSVWAKGLKQATEPGTELSLQSVSVK